jgi:hypothetical protein
MTVRTRMQALLDMVESDRRTRCQALLDQARAEAASALEQARAQARTQMRDAFADERQRARSRIAAAQAELQTRRREHAQRRVEALLVLAWQRLPGVLRQRWRDDAARQRWVRMAFDTARSALPHGTWTVVHGPHWPAAERDALAARCQQAAGAAPRFVVDERIDAGLRIGTEGSVMDATLDGLLADRDEVGGRLIGELEKAA